MLPNYYFEWTLYNLNLICFLNDFYLFDYKYIIYIHKNSMTSHVSLFLIDFILYLCCFGWSVYGYNL
jgi:hypothetical protein